MSSKRLEFLAQSLALGIPQSPWLAKLLFFCYYPLVQPKSALKRL